MSKICQDTTPLRNQEHPFGFLLGERGYLGNIGYRDQDEENRDC